MTVLVHHTCPQQDRYPANTPEADPRRSKVVLLVIVAHAFDLNETGRTTVFQDKFHGKHEDERATVDVFEHIGDLAHLILLRKLRCHQTVCTRTI